jgi:Ca-activated chloride channel family protein
MVSIQIRRAILILFLPVLALSVRAQTVSESPPPGIRVSADGVFVRVLVADPLNRYISGLGKENFGIYEDGILQTIHSFAQQSAPRCMGIIFDEKGSLGMQLDAVSSRIAHWLNPENPEDEVFLILFDQQEAKLLTFRRSVLEPNVVPLIQIVSRTALSFAAMEGLDQIRKCKGEKKALILITDGIPRGRLSTDTELGILTKQSDVELFTISALNRPGRYPAVFPVLSGVRNFIISDRTELDYYLDLIRDELANQYVLGYSPANTKKDGKWRKIEVKLNPPKGLPALVVRVGKGYNAEKK